MPELNIDKILNGNPQKVLIREYENLKNDYTKMNALKYKTLYESQSLSFILENSNYIFGEPIKGCEFYKNIMESHLIPLDMIANEYEKVSNYYESYSDKMSDEQRELYQNLLESVTKKYDSMKYSANLYTSMMENASASRKYYDALYEYKVNKADNFREISELLTEKENPNIMDTLNIMLEFPETYPELLSYMESMYYENASCPDEFRLNEFTANVLNRMMRDKSIYERVNNIRNINLRHTIKGLSGVDGTDLLTDITEEVTKVNSVVDIRSAEEAITSIYESFDNYDDSTKFENAKEKLGLLLCEKAVMEMDKSFLVLDMATSDDDMTGRNSIIEKLCIESTTIEKIPYTITGQISLLTEAIEKIDNEIENLRTILEADETYVEEKYFTADGKPSPVIAKSLGKVGLDSNDDERGGHALSDESDEASSRQAIKGMNKVYTPLSKDFNPGDEDDEDDDDKDDDDDSYEARRAKKDEKDRKLLKNEKENEALLSTISEKSDDIPKPEKRNIFQRIQNKAIDNHIKFKKKLADAKRNSVDAKNAGKAVAKIPMDIKGYVDKQVDEWDEMDDNRRKEYIIKPGIRKKYFRALKLCLLHYGAFAINPVLNVVLFIAQHFSKTKDIRIRNEIVRELEAEIAVCETKINDAGMDSKDRNKKYNLMRIKAKLEAERDRIITNSAVI